MASRKIMVIFYQNAMPQASNVIGKFLSLAFSPANDSAKTSISQNPACVRRGNVAYYFRLASQRRDNRLPARVRR